MCLGLRHDTADGLVEEGRVGTQSAAKVTVGEYARQFAAGIHDHHGTRPATADWIAGQHVATVIVSGTVSRFSPTLNSITCETLISRRPSEPPG